jgi:hypothetical protein
MSSTRAVLEDARQQGLRIEVQGNCLKLRARKKPSDDLLRALRQHKPELLRLLARKAAPPEGPIATSKAMPSPADWDSEDWQAYFDERAGIAQYDGGFSRVQAELCAFEDSVDHWLAMHPPSPQRTALCLHCKLAISAEEPTSIQVASSGGQIGLLHPECAPRWTILRRLEARRALSWLLDVMPR